MIARWLLLLLLLVAGCSRHADPGHSRPEIASGPSESSFALPTPSAQPTTPPSNAPAQPSFASLEPIVQASLDRGDAPGAVVAVVHHDNLVYRKAFGYRTVAPQKIAMSEDTIFDLASLTKPIATAACILALVEDGKLQLGSPVARLWPQFASSGKQDITIQQLLLHVSGLPPGIAVSAAEDPEALLRRIASVPLQSPPGTTFRYSDLGYVVLGEVVRRMSGRPLDRFFHDRFAEPLGMQSATFLPPAGVTVRVAPTTLRAGRMLVGEVHDPLAAALGGVAGHAGLFASVDDLAKFATMILGGGQLEGKRVLAGHTVGEMIRPRTLPGGGLRSLGWDVDTGYSGNRGRLFAVGGIGHTGFAGASIWIDRATRTAVIILTSRLHPDGKGDVRRLRSEVATAVAAAIADRSESAVVPGVDVLERRGFEELSGHRVGLVSHAASVDRQGRSTVDVLRAAPGVKLVALFALEHGLRSDVEGAVHDSVDPRSGLPVYSLFGSRIRPTPLQLAGIDTIVWDVQDVACRFYTYVTTLGTMMEAAAQQHLRFVVLDRPDPLGAIAADGPVASSDADSFTSFESLPIRYGMTPGELAQFYNGERKLGVELKIIAVENWKRSQAFEDTGLHWVRPSPNLPTPTSARLYPGVALLERTDVSVGRGTDRPFEVAGAPWVDAERWAAELQAAELPGVAFVPTHFRPSSSPHAGVDCHGVRILVTEPSRVNPVRIGIRMAQTLIQIHGHQWSRARLGELIADAPTVAAIEQGSSTQELTAIWQPRLERFESARARYLLYAE